MTKTITQKPNLSTSKALIYQGKDGAIELKLDNKNENIIANINQIAELFGRDKSVISRHIKNIYNSSELKEEATVAKIATVQKEGHREVIRDIEYYNLDMILSVGYRVDSNRATKFRIWATKILKDYVLQGYAIDKKQVAKNYSQFLEAIENIKTLLPADQKIDNRDVLNLIAAFAETWLSLDAYDKDQLANIGKTKKSVSLTAKELEGAIVELKKELLKKGEATAIFAKEREAENVVGIFGNVMQSFGGAALYPSLEEKAAHLLYFMVKNHPFVDGNKRCGAFAFVWFLKKCNLLDQSKISPQALTALTLLIAESDPKQKDKMVKLVLQMLRK